MATFVYDSCLSRTLSSSSSSTLFLACHAHGHNKNSKGVSNFIVVSENRKVAKYDSNFHKIFVCVEGNSFPYIYTRVSIGIESVSTANCNFISSASFRAFCPIPCLRVKTHLLLLSAHTWFSTKLRQV